VAKKAIGKKGKADLVEEMEKFVEKHKSTISGKGSARVSKAKQSGVKRGESAKTILELIEKSKG